MVERWSIERLDTMDRSIGLCSMRVVACNMIAPHLYYTSLRARTPLYAPVLLYPSGAPEGSEVTVHTSQPPVLCTGFEGSVASAAKDLFNFADDKARETLPYPSLYPNPRPLTPDPKPLTPKP